MTDVSAKNNLRQHFCQPEGYRLKRTRLLTQTLICVLALFLCNCKAQQKSTNIVNNNGQRYYIHTIQKKQSLYAISKLYNVSLDTLYKLNPELKLGAKAQQEIKVPFPAEDPTQEPQIDTTKFKTHTIKKGETIYSLSRRYKLSQEQLFTYNPSLAQGAKEGQVIIVGEKSGPATKENKDLAAPTPSFQIPELPIDSARFIPFSKPAKTQYNISLLLPFNLEEMAELNLQDMLRGNSEFPTISALTVDFFLGFKKAADSLAAPNFSLNLQLYDIADNDTAKISLIEEDPRFAASDLIIGPLYSGSFRTMSEKASELHTPIVSPFMQPNKILFNNIYVSKTNPSHYTLLESLADYCIDSLRGPNTNFILMTVSAKDRKEGNYTEAFKTYFNERMYDLDLPFTDTIRTAKGMEGLEKVFAPNKKNVVIALNSREVFIADFTTQLAIFAAGKDVVLCGWENVIGMDNIDQEYLNQLKYTFPHQYDITKRKIPALDKYYRQQQGTAPSIYYYIGFDLAYYYLHHLKEQGPDFVHRLDQLPMETSFMRFNFVRPDFTTGFDNRGLYIFRYNNYQLQKTGWQ